MVQGTFATGKTAFGFSACELRSSQDETFSASAPRARATLAAEMHAFSCLVPQVSHDCIGVGPFQSNARGPERPLRGTDIGGASIFGSVVAGLCDKTMEPPNRPLGENRGLNCSRTFVKRTRQRSARVFLIRIRLPLMPQDGPKSIWAELS